MNPVAFYIWKCRMAVWVFTHSFHAPHHQVNGSSIEKNFTQGYLRCRRCQSRFPWPTSIINQKAGK